MKIFYYCNISVTLGVYTWFIDKHYIQTKGE